MFACVRARRASRSWRRYSSRCSLASAKEESITSSAEFVKEAAASSSPAERVLGARNVVFSTHTHTSLYCSALLQIFKRKYTER